MTKILTVLGARPQFIKAAPLSWLLRDHPEFEEHILHTGQHYDTNMSDVFFDQLDMPKPAVNLGVSGVSLDQQFKAMFEGILAEINRLHPSMIIVYGDTTSTLAGALAGHLAGVPVAHIEAGMRSFNKAMPEEFNRIVADNCAALFFCPTQTAVKMLEAEHFAPEKIHFVGDTMFDLVQKILPKALETSPILRDLNLEPKSFTLATVHRAGNTDDPARLTAILEAFVESGETIVFPVHPRTKKAMESLPKDYSSDPNLRLIKPISLLDMYVLEHHATRMLTDSGGAQKEALFMSTPCLTLREETEWPETVDAGWNTLVGANTQAILNAMSTFSPQGTPPTAPFGDGHAAEKIVRVIEVFLGTAQHTTVTAQEEPSYGT